MKMIVALAAFLALAVGARAELPPLCGDGVHDDAAAIQARLDSGASLVYLPPPEKEYLISTTLVIRSRTELRLDRFTRVRLAPDAGCLMLINAGVQKGDRDIAVSGGIWDFDNLRQPPNQRLKPTLGRKSSPRLFWFENVRGLSVRGITFRNPVVYSCQLKRVSYFTVEDIAFEQETWNPTPINMDGVNLSGGCHHGRIANLRGTCFDDMVALNVEEPETSPNWLPITDVVIEGLYADYTHSAVRLLSWGQPVRRITIRNVHVKVYRYGVGITQFNPKKPRAVYDDIVIRDVMASATYEPDELWHDDITAWPVVWVEKKCDVGHLVIDNVSRTEAWRAIQPTIGIDSDAKVENLVIRNCRQVNETKDDMVFLTVHGKVDKLELGEVSLKSAPGAGRNIMRDDTADCGRYFPHFTPNLRPGYKPPAKGK